MDKATRLDPGGSCIGCGATGNMHSIHCMYFQDASPLGPDTFVYITDPKVDPAYILDKAKETFQERNPLYGASYLTFGDALLSLFPDKKLPEITDPEMASRLGILVYIVGKLQRYCANFAEGGHKDSIHDIINYAAMLESITK